MASINEIIAAKNDDLLVERLRVAAELEGILTQGAFTDQLTRLLGVPITVSGSETTLADVYAYAANVHSQAVSALPPPPGSNPAAVTDTHIQAALAAIRGE